MTGVRNTAVQKVVSNTGGRLPDIEDCSATARRYRDIFMAAVEDQGGLDRVSEGRLQLVRRFTAGAVLAEQMEARLMRGEEIDIAAHALLASDPGAHRALHRHRPPSKEHFVEFA